MEQTLLLTTERLKVAPDLQRGASAHGVFVIKNVPPQVYLTVSEAQARVLDSFGEGATVPEVFARLLRERRCLPLREFYELVVKASEAGVLISAPSRKPPRAALRWWALSLGTRWIGPLLAAQVLAVVALVLRAPYFLGSFDLPAVLLGGVFAAVALSAGQLLAACVLAGAGGEVYSRRPLESLAFLHPRLDLRDSRLLPRIEQALIVLVAKLPLALLLLGTLLLGPAAAPLVALAWLMAWRPWGSGLPRRLALLLSRRPALDTDSDFRFLPNQRPRLHWRPRALRVDWRVCGLELVWAALWSLLVSRLLLEALGLRFLDVAKADARYWILALSALGGTIALAAVVALVRRWREGVRELWSRVREAWALRQRRRREFVFPDTDAALQRIAATHPLLMLLNPYDRAALVRAWRPATFPAGASLPCGKDAHHVGILLSGRVSGLRANASGRHVRVLTLEEQDFFGVPVCGAGGALVGNIELRCATPVAALVAPVEVFRHSVIDRLGPVLVYDLTYKLAFLRRLGVCARWDAAAVARFSRLAHVAAYHDGDTIVREGEESNWFHIVYDGVAQVRRGERMIARLKAGDFFGEIGLLQNSAAEATVKAQGELQCLQIDRASFLRFMTHNHPVALELERISSARLGHPIFPLRSAPFVSAHAFASGSRVCYS